jgi:hypothetical protein
VREDFLYVVVVIGGAVVCLLVVFALIAGGKSLQHQRLIDCHERGISRQECFNE